MSFYKSIRFRFISWYMSALAIAFLLFSGVLYFYFQKSMKNRIDELLLLKAEGIIGSVDTYWEMERTEAIKDGGTSALLTKTRNANFAKIARRWVKEGLNDPELMNVAVGIFDPDGIVIAASENITDISNLSPEIIRGVSGKRNYFYDYQMKKGSQEPLLLRALACAVIEDKKTAYIVLILIPVSQAHTALLKLKLILFVLLPVTVCMTSLLAGEFLAGVILRPLERITRTARQITVRNLDSRIELPQAKDEIRQLAVTFNEMLEKIHNSFLSQKIFFQDVSHELRTPLAILKGEMEVALKRVRSQEEYSSILKSNLEEINRINRIIESLLFLSRFDNNEITLNREAVDAAGLLRGVLDDMDILIKSRSISVEIEAGQDIILDIDKEKFRRVFSNLLDNAVKYTPSGGWIKITLHKDKDKALIQVADNGRGISPESLPFIFDRFFQEDKARGSGGFGLGLSIVRSIVKAHQGDIRVSSQLDKGSAFIISLPLSRAKPFPLLPE